ncbi:hypothetical protein OUZ56_029854 [Daphnia magna]|uniref:Uncharacterized protein n=1 Tax=Daphnia magna TaxID=35525 RepID=A0ABR0B7Z9_9CRUS|nr:hypothetical protein OUZ56_029854 [Daphnia magna]
MKKGTRKVRNLAGGLLFRKGLRAAFQVIYYGEEGEALFLPLQAEVVVQSWRFSIA